MLRYIVGRQGYAGPRGSAKRCAHVTAAAYESWAEEQRGTHEGWSGGRSAARGRGGRAGRSWSGRKRQFASAAGIIQSAKLRTISYEFGIPGWRSVAELRAELRAKVLCMIKAGRHSADRYLCEIYARWPGNRVHVVSGSYTLVAI